MEILPSIRKGSWILVSNIATNADHVRTLVSQAAKRSGRAPEAVTVIAVTKTRSVEEVREIVAAGMLHLGENRVQELEAKVADLNVPSVTWHLIGSLQTNKARRALELAHVIHSLDRTSLADALAKCAAAMGSLPDVLIQVNVSGEESKHGVAPGDAADLARYVSRQGRLQVRGLMTMAPLVADAETVRPCFRRLRELAAELDLLRLDRVEMRWLSMGMSNDYTVAIEEGANLVRIGTALFGPRT
jgi:PLP dependent protein